MVKRSVGRPMKRWLKFDGKKYKMLTSYESKKTAESLAKFYRKKGDLARVRPWKHSDGKTLYILYIRKKMR